MVYSYSPLCAGKFVVNGPGVISGNLIETEESQAVTMCWILQAAYKAGKVAKAQEIKRVLEV